MRISDWSSDVCSSDLPPEPATWHVAGIAAKLRAHPGPEPVQLPALMPAPHERRTISCTGYIALSTGSPLIRLSRLVTSSSPARRVSWLAVVRAGLTQLAIGISSNPATENCTGTRPE